jgi:polar amino acid transport system substrate-binding protein
MPSRLARVAVLSILVACSPQEYHADTPAQYQTAAGCLQSNQDRLYATGLYAGTYLTVGTGDPAVSPWWEGGTTKEHPEWKPNDPYLGRGYEGALTSELGDRLNIPDEHIRFVPTEPEEALAPGPKPFDFAIDQLPSAAARSDDVDLSDGYYDVVPALLSVQGSRVSSARSLGDLTDATLGAMGTSGLRYVRERIRPSGSSIVYDDVFAAVRGLQDGDVDGVVVDLPTARLLAAELGRATTLIRTLPVVGAQDHFAMAFEEGSPFVECVNLALDEIAADGTLDRIRRRWLGSQPQPTIPSIHA